MGVEFSKQVEEELKKSQAQEQAQEQSQRQRSSTKQVLKESPNNNDFPQNYKLQTVAVKDREKKQVDQKPSTGSGTQTLNLNPSSSSSSSSSSSGHDHKLVKKQPSHQKPSTGSGTQTLNSNPSSSSSSSGHDHKLVKKQPSLSLSQSLQHIMKDADSPIDKSSEHKLYDQLYSGVFLHHKTQKYWMNKKSNCNCFMLYARALSITWADTDKYWRWVPLEETNGTMIEVAELKRVCWLEVHGRLDTRKLSPGILYEVSFHVMLKDTAQGWEVPINMRLVLPGGKKQEHKENFRDKVRGRWMEIPVGQFVASEHNHEDDHGGHEMEFSMYEYDGGIWKLGLLIKGVSIKPNSDDYKLAL